jgi:hypothetical protein
MEKIYSLAITAIAILFLCSHAPAQEKVLQPVSDSASLQETGKWLTKALKKSFAFPPPANDENGSYRIEDLHFADCLLTFNVAKEGAAKRNNPGTTMPDEGDTPTNGNRPTQVRIGSKVRDPLDPLTREPRIEPTTDPNHFPTPQGPSKIPKSTDRKIVDTQIFDLYQIDPATFQVTKSRVAGISYLSMINRSANAKGVEGTQTAAAGTGPDAAPAGQVISQKPGGMIPLNANSIVTIRAGFEHAIKLCQAPK